MKVPAGLGGAVRMIFRNLADAYIANSQAVATNLLQKTPSNRLSIVPNAIDSSFFEVT